MSGRHGLFAFSAFLVCSVVHAQEAGASWLADLARRCAPDVDPVTTLAIVAQESGGHPYTVGINASGDRPAESRVFDSAEDAVVAAELAIAQGRVVDLGLMQVSSPNLGRLGLTVREVLEPCANVRAGASILSQAYATELQRTGAPDSGIAVNDGIEQQALSSALSRYNTGDPVAGLRNGYVHKVKAKVPALAPDSGAAPADSASLLEAAIRSDLDVSAD